MYVCVDVLCTQGSLSYCLHEKKKRLEITKAAMPGTHGSWCEWIIFAVVSVEHTVELQEDKHGYLFNFL